VSISVGDPSAADGPRSATSEAVTDRLPPRALSRRNLIPDFDAHGFSARAREPTGKKISPDINVCSEGVVLRYESRKGLVMRIFTTLVICAAVSVSLPVYAQTENERPPANELQGIPQLEPTVVAIIAKNALPVDVQMQVEAKIAQMSKDDMQALRRSIDATPEASSALKAKGLSSAEIIAALVDDEGGLTLVINDEV
jgi:hypothetical protein